MKIANNIPGREVEEDYINIQPIQAAGRLTVEAMKALIAYGDGYSTCDQCRKPFRLDKITKPNIAEFHTDLAELLHMDEARVTPGRVVPFRQSALRLLKKATRFWFLPLLTTLSCLLYTSPSPRDGLLSRMPSSA